MRTKTQLYHYLLSFADTRLYKWYNNCLIDAFGDFSEQTIKVNTEQAQKEIKDRYTLVELQTILNRADTRILEDKNYIAICGADEPFIYTFDNFEDSLQKNYGMLDYIMDNPEVLAELENMDE